MALGLSGSNGGITKNCNSFHKKIIKMDKSTYPLEISFFINNVCNLKCRHCYVGYKDDAQALSLNEWVNTFDKLIHIGAKTFGNVGKEPLLDWSLTKKLLQYLQFKRDKDRSIRFGLVTNGLLLNQNIVSDLYRISPDYIDISLDGDEETHDYIRGSGAYKKLLQSLSLMTKEGLSDNVFISFTLNKVNQHTLPNLVDVIYKMGYKNLLISPYVTLDKFDNLYLSVNDILQQIKKLLNGEIIDFHKYNDLQLYVKSDYTTSKDIMLAFKEDGIINEDELLIDDYGVIFNKYTFGSNTIYFNYLPYDNTFIQAIRISHDGYVSGCLDMFYEDYKYRAIGNIKERDIEAILDSCDFKEKLTVFEYVE